jgi:hypothetical protein
LVHAPIAFFSLHMVITTGKKAHRAKKRLKLPSQSQSQQQLLFGLTPFWKSIFIIFAWPYGLNFFEKKQMYISATRIRLM